MKVLILKNEILDVLAKIQGMTSHKSGLAITENLLISTVDSGVKFTATDLETGFEGFYPADINAEGSIVINARKFFEIVRDFPDNKIVIEEEKNKWIKIGNDNVEYHIMGMNPEDFPETPIMENVELFDIDSSVFGEMIEKSVVIAPASDEKRAHITGIYFEIFDESGTKILRLVSTDGSRLSKVDHIFEKDEVVPGKYGIIVPKKGMIEAGKFLNQEGNVKIGIKDNNFILKKETETIIVRLVEGEFPEYKEIINKNDSENIIINKKQFLMMLKRMSILYSDSYKGVIFKFSKNNISINSTNPDIGESKEEMEIDYKGESFEVAFNPKFFMEIVNVINDENLILSIISEKKPCFIEAEKNKNYLCVIMPMRI